MTEVAWLLTSTGREAMVYDVDHATRRLTLRKRLKFTRVLTPEEARKVIETNFPSASVTPDVRMAADSLGRLKKGR